MPGIFQHTKQVIHRAHRLFFGIGANVHIILRQRGIRRCKAKRFEGDKSVFARPTPDQ